MLREAMAAQAEAMRLGLRPVAGEIAFGALRAAVEAIFRAAQRRGKLVVNHLRDFERALAERMVRRAGAHAQGERRSPSIMRDVRERERRALAARRFAVGLLFALAKAAAEPFLRAALRQQSVAARHLAKFLARQGVSFNRLFPPDSRGRLSARQVARVAAMLVGAVGASTAEAVVSAAMRQQRYTLPTALQFIERARGKPIFAPPSALLPRVHAHQLVEPQTRARFARSVQDVHRVNVAAVLLAAMARATTDAVVYAAMRQQALTYPHFYNARRRLEQLNRVTGVAYYENLLFGKPLSEREKRIRDALSHSTPALLMRELGKLAARTTADALMHAAQRRQTDFITHWRALRRNVFSHFYTRQAISDWQAFAVQLGMQPFTRRELAMLMR